ncbi:hypothetical protein HPB49_001382 [Dermacentor silvarum]|uniref:Uncharacterized protein n=1 Tax=Dermacentor silvarum TaxID=543639 RepID=A0ACB8D1Z4_DERSI|nr:hypothetical protein HPB49_001382 [Dermacentor silvarum]
MRPDRVRDANMDAEFPGHPIFSVDIHPDGSRFATGGQGSDCGQICVWNMAPVAREEEELSDSVPKLLCQMDNHLACVNCVRWSSDGRHLASGGDDKVIMIWMIGRYGMSSSGMFGGGGKTNVEHWKCVSTLRGHSGDVLDLAWSPFDSWLASCSVDNTVVIWNAKRWQEILAVLKGHTGLVKGVSWDPVGKYIASQSDDKSLRVWRTHDWQQECVITEPFLECGGTTHILRLNWSPDGQYLVSAHAMNNAGPTAQIVERDTWRTNKDFVGHRKAVTCVRFNSHIRSRVNKDNNKTQTFCCCAIGSRDRSLSVWLTCLKRPLVVVHDLFSNSVLDISWSQEGNQLLVCSWDGTVAYIDFTGEEIGMPISPDERNLWHQKLYGKSLSGPGSQQRQSGATLVEDPEVLKAQEQYSKAQQQQRTASTLSKEVNGVTPSASPATSNVPTSSANSVVRPINTNSNSSRPLPYIKGPTDKQIETRMPDGRRRITPLFIPPDPEVGDVPVPFNSQALPNFSSSTESKSRIVIEKRDESSSVPATDLCDKSSDKTPSLKAQKESAGQSAANAHQSVPGGVPQRHQAMFPALKQGMPATVKVGDMENIDGWANQCFVRKLMLACKMKKNKQCQVAQLENSKVLRSIQLQTDIPVPGSRTVSKVRCSEEEVVFWEHLVSGRGVALAASSHVVCVVCEDRTLTALSCLTGAKLMPPLLLSWPVAHMLCKGSCLLVLTTHGSLHVWDLSRRICTVRDESAGATLRASSITDEGLPLLTLTTGKSYLFSKDLGSWLLLTGSEDAVAQCSDHHASMPAMADGVKSSTLPLGSLQHNMFRVPQRAKSVFHAGPSLQQAGTLSFLDGQIAASLALRSSTEYRFWTLTLARYLVTEGLEGRLKDLCTQFLGPIGGNSQSWEPSVLVLYNMFVGVGTGFCELMGTYETS